MRILASTPIKDYDEGRSRTVFRGEVRTHAGNPILVSFRWALDMVPERTTADLAARWIEAEGTRPWTDWGSDAAIVHARRVLSRLALCGNA